MRLAIAVIGAAILWPAPSSAQPAGGRGLGPRRAAVDAAVEEVMARQHLVGVAIGVIRDGRVVYVKGYGLADREKKTPVTPETVFNWASNSKPMAAVLAMQLVDKGKLDLDADVRKYVPEFPDKGSVITARQLLCHQSGLPHYSNGKVVPAERGSPAGKPGPLASLDRFSGSPLIFRPGERTEYSSYAYILLSAVVERAGGQPYDEQVRERIAGPLRMRSLQLDHASGENWAAGYLQRKNGRVARAPEEANDWKFGAGGYKSNIGDFAAWAAVLIDHRLVSPKAERMMWTNQRTRDGKAADYGLGFRVENGRQGFKVSHNGEQAEAASRMVLYPNARHGVVVLCNSGFADIGEVSTAVYTALERR